MKLLCGPRICQHESKLFSKQLVSKYWGSFDFLISFTITGHSFPHHDRTCSSKISIFRYFGCV